MNSLFLIPFLIKIYQFQIQCRQGCKCIDITVEGGISIPRPSDYRCDTCLPEENKFLRENQSNKIYWKSIPI